MTMSFGWKLGKAGRWHGCDAGRFEPVTVRWGVSLNLHHYSTGKADWTPLETLFLTAPYRTPILLLKYRRGPPHCWMRRSFEGGSDFLLFYFISHYRVHLLFIWPTSYLICIIWIITHLTTIYRFWYCLLNRGDMAFRLSLVASIFVSSKQTIQYSQCSNPI